MKATVENEWTVIENVSIIERKNWWDGHRPADALQDFLMWMLLNDCHLLWCIFIKSINVWFMISKELGGGGVLAMSRPVVQKTPT